MLFLIIFAVVALGFILIATFIWLLTSLLDGSIGDSKKGKNKVLYKRVTNTRDYMTNNVNIIKEYVNDNELFDLYIKFNLIYEDAKAKNGEGVYTSSQRRQLNKILNKMDTHLSLVKTLKHVGEMRQ